MAARQVHTLKAVGSNPTPATSELLTLVSKRIMRISSTFQDFPNPVRWRDMCESSAGTVITPFKLWSVCIPLEVRQPQAYARAQQGTTCDCAPVVPIGRQLLSLLFTEPPNASSGVLCLYFVSALQAVAGHIFMQQRMQVVT